MKIGCLVKIVPDVNGFQYDREKNVLIRKGVPLLINPGDTAALVQALELKQRYPGTVVEAVAMAPPQAEPHLEDLVRRGFDRSLMIADSLYAGSDTLATSRVLSAVIRLRGYNLLFAGSRSSDGGTAQVPAQVAAGVGWPFMAEVTRIRPEGSGAGMGRIEADVEANDAVMTFALKRPAVLSFAFNPKMKLPYIRQDELIREVSSQIVRLSNKDIGLAPEDAGAAGSGTQVASASAAAGGRDDTEVVGCDEAGIERVYQFLKDKGGRNS